jgi:hypothetical protein
MALGRPLPLGDTHLFRKIRLLTFVGLFLGS